MSHTLFSTTSKTAGVKVAIIGGLSGVMLSWMFGQIVPPHVSAIVLDYVMYALLSAGVCGFFWMMLCEWMGTEPSYGRPKALLCAALTGLVVGLITILFVTLLSGSGMIGEYGYFIVLMFQTGTLYGLAVADQLLAVIAHNDAARPD